METFNENDEMKKIFEELDQVNVNKQHHNMNSPVTNHNHNSSDKRSSNYNNKEYNTQFDPTKMKVFSQVTIPDDDSGKYGVYIKTYKYDTNTPKVKVGRYGLKTRNVDPNDTNKFYEKDGISIDLSRPEQIKEIGEALMKLAENIKQKPDHFKVTSV